MVPGSHRGRGPPQNYKTTATSGGIWWSPHGDDTAYFLVFLHYLPPARRFVALFEDGEVLGSIGQHGENGGQFFGLHMIANDSQGNIYTGEVFNGERVQRFVPVN